MGERPDALRGTLDHLKLDPKARDDRDYLVSVLRRLGFEADELKIQDDRVVEVEFDPAKPRTTTFEIHAGAGMEDVNEFILVNEDEEVFEFKLVGEEDEGPILDTGDWDEPEWPDEGDRDDESAPVPTGTAEDDWAAAGEGSDPLWPDARDGEEDLDGDEDLTDAPPEQVSWGEPTEGTATTEEAAWPEPVEDDSAGAEELAWPDPGPEEETSSEQVAPWPEQPQQEPMWPSDEAATKPWPGAEDEAQEAQTPGTPPDSASNNDAPYTHGEYTLCTREIEVAAGAKERIYFFAKQVPNGWEASAIPAGFQVKINERNDLPYLERTGA